MKEIEKLKDKINKINELINNYQQQLIKEESRLDIFAQNQKVRELEEKIYRLREEVYRIENVIEICKKSPIISKETVDLYKNDENPHGYYTVCLKGTKTIIGEVGCNNQNNNVHYKIEDEYQNNGYGFQALTAMINYLILKNIKNIEIIIEKDNEISIKLAEKLKSIYPDFTKTEYEELVFYHFTISKRLKDQHSTNR